jgi:hypothetical protein
MPPRGHADGGGGDEALEVGRRRRRRGRGLVSPEILRRLRRFLNYRGCRSQRLVLLLLLLEEVAAWRGAVEAVGGAGGDAGDGHGDGTVKVRPAPRDGEAASGVGFFSAGALDASEESGCGGLVGSG